MHHHFAAAARLIASTALVAAATAQNIRIEIPYQKFVLANGLTVIVHEDRKAPIVAVNVWYHVGSKNELRGRTGFAHLFEHLMFNGSEHFNSDYFKVLEKLGATDLNGTTSEDRTNYFQNVPTAALDTVLWMESDRMGHLLGVVDQARLDEQRGVVQNEKRQGENEPYGLAYNLMVENSFPANHPYSWPVIGYMEDLSAATLKDVQDWFKRYYGPSNATIVLAGDIDAQTAKAKVEKYFGHIPPGPPLPRHREWIAKRNDSRRVVLEDRVPQARLYRLWNIPPDYRAETEHLRLLGNILGGGKTSRLYKRLVYTDQIATDASVFLDPMEIAGVFYIEATAKPGGDLAAVEKAIDEEVRNLVANGPTAEELKRAQTQYIAGLVRGVERIGGFGGKSDLLARAEVFTGNPDAYKASIAAAQSATVADLKRAANAWLAAGDLNVAVYPFGELKAPAATSGVDRSKVPEPGPVSDAEFPKLERATLANGLKIIVAERHATPLVNIALAVDAGYAADQFATPGTAKLAMAVLDEGTKTRTSLQISEQLESLGARLGTSANLDTSQVTLSALKPNLDASLEIFADVILNPAFPPADFAREQKLQLAAIQQEKVEPLSMGLRLMPAFIYGKQHPYGNPLTGSGTDKSVASITRDALKKFHETWFKPNNSTIVVVGDTTMAEIRPKLEKAFQTWSRGGFPKKDITRVAHRDKPVLYLMDRPGAIQSMIFAAHIAPPRANPDEISFETFNTILGGAFISRINMNLREDKHWSYGATSLLYPGRGQRPFLALAPVQTDKTRESLVEMNKELREVLKTRAVTAEELAMAQDNRVLRLPGSRETNAAVLNRILDLVQYNLPEDYYDTYAAKVRALTTRDMATAAERLLQPDKLVWVVVGDREKIEKGIRELDVAEVHLIDADGNIVK
ncbi:MAG TPA: pitrilysin family protein [Bryobacteraceae bacterium]|nr:pitrilysin family protein [Bryobacteraceae bacterium]